MNCSAKPSTMLGIKESGLTCIVAKLPKTSLTCLQPMPGNRCCSLSNSVDKKGRKPSGAPCGCCQCPCKRFAVMQIRAVPCKIALMQFCMGWHMIQMPLRRGAQLLHATEVQWQYVFRHTAFHAVVCCLPLRQNVLSHLNRLW